MVSIDNIIRVSLTSKPSALVGPNPNTVALFTTVAPLEDADEEYLEFSIGWKSAITKYWPVGSSVYGAMSALLSSSSPNLVNAGGRIVVGWKKDPDTMLATVQRVAVARAFAQYTVVEAIPANEQGDFNSWANDQDDKLFYWWSESSTDIKGAFAAAKDANLTKKIEFVYHPENAYILASGLMGYVASQNIDVINGQVNPQLKPVVGIQGQGDQSVFNDAAEVGVTCYMAVGAGDSAVSSIINNHNEVDFADTKWLKIALVADLKNAYFNKIRQAPFIPLTDSGVNIVTNLVSLVWNKYIRFGAFAPGIWNGDNTYGPSWVEDMEKQGYSIFITPLDEQSQEDRENRKFPFLYTGGKLSGMANSADVLIAVEN